MKYGEDEASALYIHCCPAQCGNIRTFLTLKIQQPDEISIVVGG